MDITRAEPEIQFGNEFDPEIVRRVCYNSKMDPKNRYYDIHNGKRVAVIFNHTKFSLDEYEDFQSDGSDLKCLKACFKKINFEVKAYQNITADQTQVVMDYIAKIESHVSCLVVVIMTHGNGTHLAASDKIYETSMLWKCLEGKMIGVPKLFFIDACRGAKMDKGIEVADSVSIEKNYKFKLPTMADYLFMYATNEGHVSYTSAIGSYFIISLCAEIINNYKEYDILQILTFVCQDVAVKYNVRQTKDGEVAFFKMMPQIVSMLTKLLKFDMAPK